jgi:hypothetical protein
VGLRGKRDDPDLLRLGTDDGERFPRVRQPRGKLYRPTSVLKVALGGDFALEPLDRQSFKGIGEAAAWTVRMRS